MTTASFTQRLADKRHWVGCGFAGLASMTPLWLGATSLGGVSPAGECGFLCLPILFAIFCFGVAALTLVLVWFIVVKAIQFLWGAPE